MQSLKDFALGMISQNPNIKNNPNMREMLDVIQRGDSARGEQIATNLCSTFGVPKDKAINDAKRFFNIP